jgi:hypothetical protein
MPNSSSRKFASHAQTRLAIQKHFDRQTHQHYGESFARVLLRKMLRSTGMMKAPPMPTMPTKTPTNKPATIIPGANSFIISLQSVENEHTGSCIHRSLKLFWLWVLAGIPQYVALGPGLRRYLQRNPSHHSMRPLAYRNYEVNCNALFPRMQTF